MVPSRGMARQCIAYFAFALLIRVSCKEETNNAGAVSGSCSTDGSIPDPSASPAQEDGSGSWKLNLGPYAYRDPHLRTLRKPASQADLVFDDGLGHTGGDRLRRTIMQRQRVWSDVYSLVAVVEAQAAATAVHVMVPTPRDGLAAFVVVGDAAGHLHLFKPNGELDAELNTGGGVAVTALTSHRLSHNTSVLAAAHMDGSLTLITITLHIPRSGWSEGASVVEAEIITAATGEPSGESAACGPVSELQSYRMGPVRKYSYVGVSAQGRICVWDSMGELQQSAEADVPVLAMRAHVTHVTMITTSGLASLRLQPSSKSEAPTVASFACFGLNGSRLTAATWAVDNEGQQANSRVYALSEEGELLSLSLGPGDHQHSCKVRIRQANAVPPGEARILAQRGTLLAVSGQTLTLYNTSNLLWSKGPEALLQDSLEQLAEEIGLLGRTADFPILATSGRLLAVGLGGRLLALYEAGGNVGKGPTVASSMMWIRPVFLVILFFVGLWTYGRVRSTGNSGEWPEGYGQGLGGRRAGGIGEDSAFIRGVRSEIDAAMREDAIRRTNHRRPKPVSADNVGPALE